MDEKFPIVSITGGPHGRTAEMLVDGQRLRGVTGFKLSGMVNDVLRLKTYQIVRAAVSVEAELSNEARVTVSQWVDEGEIILAESKADTIWEALADCARQLELQAKREPPVAPGGTITGSTGRPPGL